MNKQSGLVKKYGEISDELLSKDPICQLLGNEFSPIEGKTLRQQVIEHFKTFGEVVSTKFGEVFLDKKGVKNALNHGMGRTKAVAFAAIKPTLEKGIVILPLDYYNVHGKNQRTGMIAAPIAIQNEKYICVVVVIANSTINRLYVHEVFLTKNLLEGVADSNAVRRAKSPVTHPQGEVAKVLKKYIQNIYSREEILNHLNGVQYVDNNDDNKKEEIKDDGINYEDTKIALSE